MGGLSLHRPSATPASVDPQALSPGRTRAGAAHQAADRLRSSPRASAPARDIRPPAITAMRSARTKISSRSCEMIITAAPASASAMIASWIASAAPGIHAPGRLVDHQHARAPAKPLAPPGISADCRRTTTAPRPSDRWCARRSVLMMCSAKSRRASCCRSRRNEPARGAVKPDRNAFSASVMVVTAPCPLRSSGTKQPRMRRRSCGPICPAGTPSIMTLSGRPARISPDSASISSRLAVAGDAGDAEDLAARQRQRNVLQICAEMVRRADGQLVQHQPRRRRARRQRPRRRRVQVHVDHDLRQFLDGLFAPAITRATFLPSRMMVAAEHSARTSSSLWLM